MVQNNEVLIKRIQGVENEQINIKEAIDDNSNLTNKGFDNINDRLDEMKDMLVFYQSTRFGAKFLAWVGTFIISISTIWILIRDVLHVK